MTELKPREARTSDLESVLRLIEACQLPIEGITAHFPTSYLVVDSDQGLVGVAGVERYEAVGLLRSVAVAPGVQSEGVGGLLVKAAVTIAVKEKFSALYLLTTDADSYFSRFGFQVIGRADVHPSIAMSEEFSQICPEPAVVMRLELSVRA